MRRLLLLLLPVALMPVYAGVSATIASGAHNHRHGMDGLALHNGVVLPGFGLGAAILIVILALDRGWRFRWLAVALLAVAFVCDQYMIWRFVLVDHLALTPSHILTHVENTLLAFGGFALALSRRERG